MKKFLICFILVLSFIGTASAEYITEDGYKYIKTTEIGRVVYVLDQLQPGDTKATVHTVVYTVTNDRVVFLGVWEYIPDYVDIIMREDGQVDIIPTRRTLPEKLSDGA